MFKRKDLPLIREKMVGPEPISNEIYSCSVSV